MSNSVYVVTAIMKDGSRINLSVISSARKAVNKNLALSWDEDFRKKKLERLRSHGVVFIPIDSEYTKKLRIERIDVE